MAAGRDEDAQWRTARAWQLDPGNVLALTQLVDHHCRAGHVWGEAGAQTKALIRRALHLAREVPDVMASRVHYHMARGEQHTGMTLLQQYTTQHARCPAGWYYYAHWCFHTGALQEAATAMLRAHALAPCDPTIYQGGLLSLQHISDAQQECTDCCGCDSLQPVTSDVGG